MVVVVGLDGGADESPEVFRALSAGSSAFADAAAGGGGEETSPPPPSSAESNFRELDDVFLQNQARIWLGEVLQIRSDEQLHIADLLADGELLFEVSREIWTMLLVNHAELRYVKAYKYEPFASRKGSGRYMPYSNVDSFLKVCKILGLAGIDLFSPSDVVERKNTRKVCMCIRSLSKKARSGNLNVPDFDIVTYTVAMPTDMVGNIRRSWEMSSRCNFCSSASKTPHHESRRRSTWKHSLTTSGGNYVPYLEESGEAESKFMLQSGGSITSCSYEISSQANSDLRNSPGVSSVVKDYSFGQCSLELEDQNQHKEEDSEFQRREDCFNESTRSLFSQHLEYDHQLDSGVSPSFADSNIYFGSGASHSENGDRNGRENSAVDLVHVNLSLEDDASVVGDSGDSSTPRRNHIVDMDVSSVASVNSVSCAVQSSNFADLFDTEEEIKTDLFDTEEEIKTIWFSESPNNKVALLTKKSAERSECQDIVTYKTPGNGFMTESEEESPFGIKVVDTSFSSKRFVPFSSSQYNTGCLLDHPFLNNNGVCVSRVSSNLDSNDERELFSDWRSVSNEFHQWDQKGKRRIASIPAGNDGHGDPSLSLSPDETLQSAQGQPATDASLPENTIIKHIIVDDDTEGHSASIAESDPDIGKQLDKCSQATCFNIFNDKANEDLDSLSSTISIVESKNSHNIDSGTDSYGFPHLSDSSVSCSQGELIPDEPCCRRTENAGENDDQGSTDQEKHVIFSGEDKEQLDNESQEKVQIPATDNSDVTKEPIAPEADRKPLRRPLLKSVATGTAAVGVLLLFLHFRKNGREKTGKSSKQSNGLRKANGRDFSSRKDRKGSRAETDKVYPAEKLKFGI